MGLFDLTAERERLQLAADCSKCFGLCCVAHGFKASDSFAFDKLPGTPCPNLLADFGCNIHRTLRPNGFSGCTAYTCYGAGQKVAQEIFGGVDWRQAPETAELMFQTLPIVRQLNHLLWYITEALDHSMPGADYQELLELLDETERLAATPATEMSWGAIDEHCQAGESLLSQVSAGMRATALSAIPERPAVQSRAADPLDVSRLEADLRAGDARQPDHPGVDRRGTDLRGADLRGADLRGLDLSGVDLRGADLWAAVLSNADLSGADLRWTDLMGADLRHAKLAGADLSATIFLTQSQLELAQGDARTTLSGPLLAPAHWSGVA